MRAKAKAEADIPSPVFITGSLKSMTGDFGSIRFPESVSGRAQDIRLLRSPSCPRAGWAAVNIEMWQIDVRQVCVRQA